MYEEGIHNHRRTSFLERGQVNHWVTGIVLEAHGVILLLGTVPGILIFIVRVVSSQSDYNILCRIFFIDHRLEEFRYRPSSMGEFRYRPSSMEEFQYRSSSMEGFRYRPSSMEEFRYRPSSMEELSHAPFPYSDALRSVYDESRMYTLKRWLFLRQKIRLT